MGILVFLKMVFKAFLEYLRAASFTNLNTSMMRFQSLQVLRATKMSLKSRIFRIFTNISVGNVWWMTASLIGTNSAISNPWMIRIDLFLLMKNFERKLNKFCHQTFHADLIKVIILWVRIITNCICWRFHLWFLRHLN